MAYQRLFQGWAWKIGQNRSFIETFFYSYILDLENVVDSSYEGGGGEERPVMPELHYRILLVSFMNKVLVTESMIKRNMIILLLWWRWQGHFHSHANLLLVWCLFLIVGQNEHLCQIWCFYPRCKYSTISPDYNFCARKLEREEGGVGVWRNFRWEGCWLMRNGWT